MVLGYVSEAGVDIEDYYALGHTTPKLDTDLGGTADVDGETSQEISELSAVQL